eukprot:1795144-Amphidinium_carterae.3
MPRTGCSLRSCPGPYAPTCKHALGQQESKQAASTSNCKAQPPTHATAIAYRTSHQFTSGSLQKASSSICVLERGKASTTTA